MSRTWTEKEKQYVMSNHAHMTDRQIAAKLSLITGKKTTADDVTTLRAELKMHKTSEEEGVEHVTAPHKKRGPIRYAEIDGEVKTLREWSLDARCEVTLATLRQRYEAGCRGRQLITKKVKRGRPIRNKKLVGQTTPPPEGVAPATEGRPAMRVEIFGESKTLREWAADERCKVGLNTVRERYKHGKRGGDLICEKRDRSTPAPGRDTEEQRGGAAE